MMTLSSGILGDRGGADGIGGAEVRTGAGAGGGALCTGGAGVVMCIAGIAGAREGIEAAGAA